MGGLRTEWEVGNLRVGTEVRMILLRQRRVAPIGAEVGAPYYPPAGMQGYAIDANEVCSACAGLLMGLLKAIGTR
jgi:hypothetical protein